jgi:hypothetical protein
VVFANKCDLEGNKIEISLRKQKKAKDGDVAGECEDGDEC